MSLIQGDHACCSLHVCFSVTIHTTSRSVQAEVKTDRGSTPIANNSLSKFKAKYTTKMKIFMGGCLLMSTLLILWPTFSTCIPLVGDRYFLYIIMPQLRVLLIIIIIMVLLLYTEYFSNLFQYSNKFLLFFISSWVSTHGIWSYDKTHSSPLPVHQKVCGKHTYISAATTTIQKYYFPKTELELFIPE